MKFKRKIRSIFNRNAKAFKISIFNALAVFLLCYFIDNLPYSFIEDATLGQHFEQIKQYVNQRDEKLPNDLVLVNISYDRQLVDVTDEFGFPKGNIDITDRSKLFDFLNQIKDAEYKYLVLDVSFSNEYKTEQDSALFDLIVNMENIVVAKSEKFTLADSSLLKKARYCDYSTHISESNFVKYEYIRNHETTLPYQMYKDLFGTSIQSFGGFYFFNGRLANKSIVLRHPIKLWNKTKSLSETNDIAQLQYYNLGSDILEMGVDIPSWVKDKIVVIGDFCENDIHDTYLGKIAGPIINLNAFYALVNDNLSIPYFEIIFLLILYFTISMFILKNVNIFKYLPFTIKSNTISFVFSFIGLSFVLTTIALLWYIMFGLDVNILIPSIYFSIFGIIIKYHKTIAKS